VHAVCAHHVSGAHLVATREFGGYAAVSLLERLQLTRPLHTDSNLAEPLDQYGFSHGLGYEEREPECGWQPIEGHDHENLVVVTDRESACADPLCDQALRDSIWLEYFERARVDHRRSGRVLALWLAVED
jgi:hypothetical protein